MSALDDKYSVNETLLQSYRSIFISSQSFLLAVGAIVSGKSPCVLYITTIVGLSMIWFLWFPVVKSRHRIVDHYKFSAKLSESELKGLCSVDEYVHDRKLRAKANKLFKITTNWRETRKKVDFWIPFLFSVIWIVLSFNEFAPLNQAAQWIARALGF
jgi:hypothetical protein